MFIGKEMAGLITYAAIAHQEHSRKPSKAVRIWDKETPYVAHSVWGAMTILHETQLPEEIRNRGSQALICHDILEDTTAQLPDIIDSKVVALVQEVTFPNQEVAMEKIWERSDEAILITLFDMVSNMMDGAWMNEDQRRFYTKYITKLKDMVRNRFGDLNIVKIAEVIS